MRRFYLLPILLPLLCTACSNQQNTPIADAQPARSYSGMVSSASVEATDVGVEVLRNGGNAVDAAVAVGFALAVTLPQAGNLGGGGFMVVRMADGRTTTLDFRETAPAAATRDMYLDSAGNFLPARSQVGALAAGVPGTTDGLLMALDRFGTRQRGEILRGAIRLAEEGFTINQELAEDLTEKREQFRLFASSSRLFADSGGLAVGMRFKQSELAGTLHRISDSGRAGFYSGTTAGLIVEQMKVSGGIITRQDLLAYHPVERTPLISNYRNHTIISMPPPSSGGVGLIEMLNMMEPRSFAAIPYHSATHAHLLAEIMRRAYADRAEFLGDPDFYDVPVAGLTNPMYAWDRAGSITDRATPSDSIGHGDPSGYIRESPQTTHYSVADKDGNCVSVTVTLNSSFGCKLAVDGAGFLLNNEMDDFSAKPNTPNLYGLVGRDANAIAPGKRMLSSMTPTIVLRNEKPWLIVGTPGGSTIISTVLQVIHNQIDYNMDLVSAVESPRLHHQWRPDTIFFETGAFAADAGDSLRIMGYHTLERSERSGRVDAIRIEEENGRRLFLGWSDSRGAGAAKGSE